MTHGLGVIETSAQATHEWINELAERIETDDRRRALRLLRETLHALRDVLSHDEAAHLAAQLPVFLRGIYYEGWRPSATPVPDRSGAAFLARIARAFDRTPDYPVRADVEEVFRLLAHRISDGEVQDLRGALAADLRELWP